MWQRGVDQACFQPSGLPTSVGQKDCGVLQPDPLSRDLLVAPVDAGPRIALQLVALVTDLTRTAGCCEWISACLMDLWRTALFSQAGRKPVRRKLRERGRRLTVWYCTVVAQNSAVVNGYREPRPVTGAAGSPGHRSFMHQPAPRARWRLFFL